LYDKNTNHSSPGKPGFCYVTILGNRVGRKAPSGGYRKFNNEYKFILVHLRMRVKDEQKIDLFYSSTLTLVSKVGLVGLTIPLIAKTSGVATGTLYIYFKNKEDLILALHKKIKNRFGANAFIGYNSDLPSQEGLRVIWENCLRYAALNYPEQVFLQQFVVSPYSRDKGQLLYAQETMAPLFQALQAAQSQSLIKSDKEGLTIKLLFGFITQIAADLHETPQLLTNSYIDKTFSYFWDAIKT